MRTRLAAATLSVAALLVLASSASFAQTKAFTYVPDSEFTNGTWSLGWEFTLNSAVNVVQLGYYDDADNDLTESHQVGIFDNVGNLIVSSTVYPGDPLDNHFRYVSIPSTPLSAGTTYVITGVTGSENYGFFGAVTTAPEVNFIQDRFVSTTTLDFPTFSAGLGNAWFGPNFKFDAAADVPEPGAVAFGVLAAGSVLGLVARRRKA